MIKRNSVLNNYLLSTIHKLRDKILPIQFEKAMDVYNGVNDFAFEYISKKCESFKMQDASRSPEQRKAHESKVKVCLESRKK